VTVGVELSDAGAPSVCGCGNRRAIGRSKRREERKVRRIANAKAARSEIQEAGPAGVVRAARHAFPRAQSTA
jgi:hypothetical protein